MLSSLLSNIIIYRVCQKRRNKYFFFYFCVKLDNQWCRVVRRQVTRVSQFCFKKSFASKRNVAKQKRVSLRFASVSRNHKKKFCFVSLRKFRFISLKKRFTSVVSFFLKSFASKVLLYKQFRTKLKVKVARK